MMLFRYIITTVEDGLVLVFDIGNLERWRRSEFEGRCGKRFRTRRHELSLLFFVCANLWLVPHLLYEGFFFYNASSDVWTELQRSSAGTCDNAAFVCSGHAREALRGKVRSLRTERDRESCNVKVQGVQHACSGNTVIPKVFSIGP